MAAYTASDLSPESRWGYPVQYWGNRPFTIPSERGRSSTMNHRTRRSALAGAMALVFALLVSGCGAGFGFGTPNSSVSASATASPSASPSAAPTLSEKEAVTAEAQEFVRLMVANFKGVTTIPEECVNANFGVDLTAPEFYRNRGGKETAGAFGPSMGTTPCDVSRNRVERYFRDSSLLVTKANETGVEKTKPADVAAKVTKLHNGPYQERLKLARKVLGWYTDPNRELTLVKKDGVYTSNTMKGNGTTATSYGNKPSLVLETRDRRNGKVVKGDRMNCGDQDYTTGIPKGYKPPKRGEETPKLTKLTTTGIPKGYKPPPAYTPPPAPQPSPPSENKLTPKNVGDHPVNKGNAPRDQWTPAPRIDERQEPATKPGGGTPPKTYTPPPVPTKPTPTVPRPEPTPEPPPTTQPVPSGTPTCDPDICG